MALGSKLIKVRKGTKYIRVVAKKGTTIHLEFRKTKYGTTKKHRR